jgi:hypothetical protein
MRRCIYIGIDALGGGADFFIPHAFSLRKLVDGGGGVG